MDHINQLHDFDLLSGLPNPPTSAHNAPLIQVAPASPSAGTFPFDRHGMLR